MDGRGVPLWRADRLLAVVLWVPASPATQELLRFGSEAASASLGRSRSMRLAGIQLGPEF